MLDLSDDEELQRLREAALKSKRKTGILDKTEDFNQEAEENKIPQVPVNLPLQVQTAPSIYPPFFGPLPPIIRTTRPPLMLALSQPLSLSQHVPVRPTNNLNFSGYHFINHPQAPVLNQVAPTVCPRINSLTKKMDLGRTISPGYKSSNLIVITGNEPKTSSFNSNSMTFRDRNSPKIEAVHSDQRRDKWNAEKDHSPFAREEKARISKFERYKSNESSEDEENYISPSDESDEEFCSKLPEVKIKDIGLYDKKQKSSLSSSSNGSESDDFQQDEETKNGFTSEDQSSEEENASAENEPGKPETSSKSPMVSIRSADHKRMLSFSDDVEDLHLDIPNISTVQADGQQRHEEEKCTEAMGASAARRQRNFLRKRSPRNSGSSSEKERPTSPKNRDRPPEKIRERKLHGSPRAERRSSRSRNTKSVVNKIESNASMGRRTERPKDPNRSVINAKRKYNISRDDYYERGRSFRKTRYFDERDLAEYSNDYREYSRGYAHHQRCYDKNEAYPIREQDEYYFYTDDRRGHEEYSDRMHDNYYYFEQHRAEDDDRYRYSPQHKRYRMQERDHYRDSSEREALRLERRYDEEHYPTRANPSKRHLNTNNIPSLLEGIFIKGDIDKRYAVDNLREKFRPTKLPIARLEEREHLKQFKVFSRLKESHEDRPKKEDFRSKNDKKDNKESTDRKPSRRVVESRNGEKERHGHSDVEVRSRDQDECDNNLKILSVSDKKLVSHASKNIERHSIHRRLGMKPDKKNVSCKVGSPTLAF